MSNETIASLNTEQFTRLPESYPPKNTLIEWVTPGGQIVRGTWAGGMVWFPEGGLTYVYYTPLSWRLVPARPDDRKA